MADPPGPGSSTRAESQQMPFFTTNSALLLSWQAGLGQDVNATCHGTERSSLLQLSPGGLGQELGDSVLYALNSTLNPVPPGPKSEIP